jgi:DGQHR domain-containing protein
VKFFFADSVDTVDPQYDFLADKFTEGRNRQKDDLYPHEVLGYAPYDGILVSRALIGTDSRAGRYSQGQKYRLLREGARKFLRYPHADHSGTPDDYPIMGDCGAFSYVDADRPPYSPEQMCEFYETCGFTHGVSPDHIILQKNRRWRGSRRPPVQVLRRAEITSQYAVRFLEVCHTEGASFHPIGVVQCWDSLSACRYATTLVQSGYSYIGLGGMAARPTDEVYAILSAVRATVPDDTLIHIFGFNRIDRLADFAGLNITSFDSTSPLLKAFKDDLNNYYCPKGRHYCAVKMPSMDESTLKGRIQSGELDLGEVKQHEQAALKALRNFAAGEMDLDRTLDAVCAYEKIHSPTSRNMDAYARTLHDKPWERCTCSVCRELGVEVVLFRGLNRNKRRGFHNLHVFYDKLKEVCRMKYIEVPCIRLHQAANRPVYSFVVKGTDILRFASVSRIRRDDRGDLLGYQRPEILDHIQDITAYLEKKDAILPNSIVVAFNEPVQFRTLEGNHGRDDVGVLRVPISDGQKAGWIVDGQQRVAALRSANRHDFEVSVIAFESRSVEDERTQFVLVNSTRPLPKSLVYELLPSIAKSVPPKLRKRQRAYCLLERLNLDPASPFHSRIRTTTSRNIPTANITDTSVLRMIENSFANGVLSRYPEGDVKPAKMLTNFWGAVRSYYDEAWDLSPRKSRLTHGVGIISMGFIMDAMAHRLSETWKIPPKDAFEKELDALGKDLCWTEGVWRFSKQMMMPWNELQNTHRHIDLVANYLIRKYRRGCRRREAANTSTTSG